MLVSKEMLVPLNLVFRMLRSIESRIHNSCRAGQTSHHSAQVKTLRQLPPVIESLTGIKFEKLLEQVPALRNAMGKGTDDKK